MQQINKRAFQGVEGEGGGERKGIEGIAAGIVGMLGRGGSVALSTLGNVGNPGMVGSGGSAPGRGNAGMDGCGRLGVDGSGRECGCRQSWHWRQLRQLQKVTSCYPNINAGK
ncbi:hypothetical protein ERO13_A13G069651v2 [Gossypium hirsutum]|uniref:Uncharacterized protein n=2 Tax=Gossypium TaxID=3633 RepID=A0A5D2MI28_GOSTO|nr:hypothetical protein ERO13_A13G069651v2 [Gossypium hirsutum]TYG85720.1 hypothetical protein ES288_A13G077700v1 [Gossypium darwinii]TYH90904.1 hypothetical protein ES332_A13G081000v1 [Gossypium tomentosum]